MFLNLTLNFMLSFTFAQWGRALKLQVGVKLTGELVIADQGEPRKAAISHDVTCRKSSGDNVEPSIIFAFKFFR